MVFKVQGKVCLITGGASGLGLEYAKELLRNGAKGVTLADVDPKFGEEALSQINREFGPNKAIFVKADVTNIQQFEEAFKETIDKYKCIDILINNAGILNDAVWEREIAINVNGIVHGMLLGMDYYLSKYKQDEEAVIVNISSTCGVEGYGHIPVYCGTKFAVIGMSKSWSIPYHYERTKVRVIVVCPGVTNTPLISGMETENRTLGQPYETYIRNNSTGWLRQETDHVAKEMVRIIEHSPNGSVWIVEGGEPAYEFPTLDRNELERKYLQPKN